MGKKGETEDISFYLEASLTGLAKWLRFFGYPAQICDKKLKVEEVLKHKDKIFLITSKETAEILSKVGVRYLLIPRENLKTQLNFVVNRLNLRTELRLNICTVCGSKLIPKKKEEVKSLVPERVYKTYEEFNYCPCCGRVYWEGDHIKRLKARLKNILVGGDDEAH